MITNKPISNFSRSVTRLIAFMALMFTLIGHVSIASAAAVPVELCAKAGSVTMPNNANVTFWGYGIPTIPGDCNTATASLPGPIIDVSEGDVVTITLHNNLSESTALLFQGQGLPTDLLGAAANGGTKMYTFTATNPGTFLYEAGLLANAEHQTAMGLYGALIVRPATSSQAYDNAATTFDDEAVLVLSEIDPALNNNANPAAFDMRNYAPRYFLINGKAYPATDSIPSAAGNKVLLRYVNAGIQQHSMAVLGLRQNFVAKDGSLLPTLNHNVAAESLAPGQTGDAIVTIPSAATTASKFAVYDGSLMLRNSNAPGFGGMLTFVTTGTTVIGPPIGPTTSSVALSPSLSNGSADATLTATISSGVTAAEYFVDSVGANGTGCAITGSLTNVNVTIPVSGGIAPCVDLTTLTSGNHTFYIHGTNGTTWGAVASAVLKLDKAGPVSSGLTLTPNPSNGSVSVALSATGNDSATGGSNVTAAEYTIDGGAAVTMTLGGAASPTRSLSATIPSGLSVGSHTVAVRSQDVLGNWGAPATITLNVVANPPVTSNVSASKNPNNGAFPLNASQPVVRITATMTSIGSTVSAAEGFIDSNPATTVRGFPFVPSDGAFNSATETGYGDIPLTTVNTLSAGNHTIYVRGKDAVGNWGVTATTILVIDKTAPTVSSATLTPSASNNTAVAISVSAADTACIPSICTITGGEYFIDTVGAAGTGIVMTPAAISPTTTLSASISAATVGSLTTGNHTVYVRAKDAAGNWSTTTSATLLIDRTPPTFSSITLTPNSISVGTASITLTVNGASDGAGGSGVTGGEWWFGSTNITAGTGTAFTGTSGISIPTDSLVAGSYTIRVRIRDAAGNWSTGNNGVRTATLTVTAPIPDLIFSNGFETGSRPWGWTSASTNTTSRLNVTAGAALVDSLGLQAQGNNTNYVQYDFGTAANPASGTFDARFYFNPNGNTGTNQDIFVARTTGGTTVFRVRYRMNGAQPQVQIQVGTGIGNTAWTNITNNASNRIEVVWQSGSTLQLFVGTSVVANQSLVATATSVGQFRLGSVTSGGIATLEYFDAISAKRSTTPYGP